MDAPALSIRDIPWSPAAEKALTHQASARCLELLKREVLEGVSQLWECRAGVDVLHVITRLEVTNREWVICLAVGSGLRHFMPYARQGARSRGLTLRIHTSSRAVVRLLEREGLELQEFVLRGN